MNYTEFGPEQRQTIMLVHGAGAAGWIWKKQTDALKKDFHCLVPDLPDHGGSRAIPFTSLPEVARDLIALIKAKGHGGRALVMGHSLGAKLVVCMLAEPDNGIDRAVVASPLFRSMPLVRLFSRPTAIRLMLACTRNQWLMRQQVKAYGFNDPEMEAAVLDETARTTVDGMGRYLRAFNATMSLPPELAHSTVPTLLIHASAEGRAMAASVQDMLQLNPAWRAVRIAQSNHFYPVQRAELFNRIIREWAAGQVASDPALTTA